MKRGRKWKKTGRGRHESNVGRIIWVPRRGKRGTGHYKFLDLDNQKFGPFSSWADAVNFVEGRFPSLDDNNEDILRIQFGC